MKVIVIKPQPAVVPFCISVLSELKHKIIQQLDYHRWCHTINQPRFY